jgi:hypothetical protein
MDIATKTCFWKRCEPWNGEIKENVEARKTVACQVDERLFVHTI